MAAINNIYVLIGEMEGKVEYGIDIRTYLIGVYDNYEDAEKTMLGLQDSNSVFVSQDTTQYGNLYVDSMGVLTYLNKDAQEAEKKKLICYKDLLYFIYKVDNLPLWIGGGHYLE